MSSYNGVRGENAADGFRIRSTLSRTPCAGLPDRLQRYTQSEDAEDVLPNVFLKLIRREFPPDLKKNPKGYFYRAALNAALDLVRARQRDALTGEAERFVNAVPQDPEFAEEAERRLYDAIATLHPTAVQILMLRYVHNHSLSQIATLLGTTRSIVAVSLFRSASGCESLFAPLEQSHEAQKRKSLRAFEPLSWPILQSLERTDPIGRRSRSSSDARLLRLRTAAPEPDSIHSERRHWNIAAVFAGIAAVLVVVASVIVWRMNEANKVVPATDPRVYRAEQILPSSAGKDSLATLEDGSRVEMRAGSEAAVENAADGLRIRLNAGSIIVNTEKSLRPGEQVSSNPKMETAPVAEQIGWSRDAAAYLAMLHQELDQGSGGSSIYTKRQPGFGQAAIRSGLREAIPAGFPCARWRSRRRLEFDSAFAPRLDALCMTVATLIRTAYRPLRNNSPFPVRESTLPLNVTASLGRENGTRVRGGPDWVRSEKYLLESRFQLKTHIESEQIPVFALTIAKSGLKIKRAGPQSCVRSTAPTGPVPFDPRLVFRELESVRAANP